MGHCEERSDEAISPGLLRYARNDNITYNYTTTEKANNRRGKIHNENRNDFCLIDLRDEIKESLTCYQT
jgi:hypothetical protein